MLLFFAFVALLFGLSCLSLFFKKKALLFLAIGCGLCWLFCGIKSITVGTDSSAYFTFYQRIDNASFSYMLSIAKKDYGFYSLMWICSKLGMNYLIFQLFIYLIIWSNVFFFIYLLSKNKCTALYLVFCLSIAFFMTGLRQAFAISLILVSYALLQHASRTKLYLYFISLPLMIVSGAFHFSGFVVAGALILLYFVARGLKIGLLIFSSIYVFALISIESFYSLGTGLFNTNYIPHDFSTIPSTSVMFFAIIFFMYFMFYKRDLIVSLYNKYAPKFIKNFYDKSEPMEHEEHIAKLSKNELYFDYVKSNDLLVWASCAGAITMAFCVANSNFMRFGYYFEPFLALCFANCLGTIKNKKMYITLSVLAFVVFTAYFAISTLRSPNVNDILRYEIW